VVVFTLPKVNGGRDWRRLVDTNLPGEDDDLEDAVTFKFGHRYQVTGRSLLMFLLRPARTRRPAGRDEAGSRPGVPST
jgi:glycogen operon protein